MVSKGEFIPYAISNKIFDTAEEAEFDFKTSIMKINFDKNVSYSITHIEGDAINCERIQINFKTNNESFFSIEIGKEIGNPINFLIIDQEIINSIEKEYKTYFNN